MFEYLSNAGFMNITLDVISSLDVVSPGEAQGTFVTTIPILQMRTLRLRDLTTLKSPVLKADRMPQE